MAWLTSHGLALCCCLLATALSLTPQVTVADSSASLGQIVEAWRARQNRVRSARFEWCANRYDSADGYQAYMRMRRQDANFTVAPLRFEEIVSLSLDGHKLAYATSGLQFIVEAGNFMPRSYKSVYNGEHAKSFFSGDASGARVFQPGGTVFTENCHPDLTNNAIMAILLNYRPLDPQFSQCNLESYAVTGEGSVGGRRCVLLEEQAGTSFTWKYWVDLERDCTVLRVVHGHPNRVVFKLDISYEAVPNEGWVPTKWTGVVFTRLNTVGFQFDAKVVRHEFNSTIPASEFDIDFPPGTVVADRVSNQTYIVKEDARSREVTQEELMARGQHGVLIPTEGKERASRSSRWAVLGIVITVAVMVGAACVYRRFRCNR